jgi:hypothetical protein
MKSKSEGKKWVKSGEVVVSEIQNVKCTIVLELSTFTKKTDVVVLLCFCPAMNNAMLRMRRLSIPVFTIM